MNTSLPHRVRAHGRPPLVVVAVVLVALLSLARPAGAVGAPVDPAPVGVWPLQPTPEVVQRVRPAGLDAGAPGIAGSTWPARSARSCTPRLPGRVTFAARLAGRGVVVVDHGSTRTTYEPVVASVKVGDILARGQPIGSLELAGSHCFPRACLHWGWRRGDTYLDPLLLVGGGPIVLLPLWQGSPIPPPTVPSPPYADLLSRLLLRSPPSSRHTRPTGRVAAPVDPAWHRPLAMRPLLL